MNKENIIDYVVQTPHNPNKKVLDDMLETFIEENGKGGSGECDWNSMKNKPFEATTELVEVLSSREITTDYIDEEPYEDGNFYYSYHYEYDPDWVLDSLIKDGHKYHIYINGEEYVHKAKTQIHYGSDGPYNHIYLGNDYILGIGGNYEGEESFENNGEPFVVIDVGHDLSVIWQADLGEAITIEIVEEQENIKQLDGKFVEGTNFIVTITQRFEEEGGEEPLYAKDKSFEEIMMAYKSGRNVLALFKAYEEEGEGYFSHYIIPITHCSDTSIVFTGHEYWDNGISIEISSYDPPLDVLVSEHSLSSTEEQILSNVNDLIDQKLSSIGVAEGGEF